MYAGAEEVNVGNELLSALGKISFINRAKYRRGGSVAQHRTARNEVNYHNAVHARWPKRGDIVPFCTLSGFVQISGSSLEGIAGTRLELATSARQFSRDRFYSNLQERGDCQNTVRRTRLHELWVGLWVGKWPGRCFPHIVYPANRVRFKTYTSSIPRVIHVSPGGMP